MTNGLIRTSFLVAGIFVTLCAATSAHALSDRQKCVLAIPKAAQKYVAAKVKLEQKCKNAGFKDGSCTMPDSAAVAKIEAKLDAALTKACSLIPFLLRSSGFPGPCSDPNPGDDFTTADLKACIKASHDAFVADLLALQYDTTLMGQLGDDLKCQAEVAKQSSGMASCVLKSVGKCRDAILKGKSSGVPDLCATQDPKTIAAIAKCEAKLTAGIAKKCTAQQITDLKVCTPDQTDAGSAATCLINAQDLLIDTPAIDVPADVIDYEYATRGGLCGDLIVNHPNEECDGPDDSACPGLCGTASVPDGFFACLCKDKPRMVVVHDADADTDNGWTGQSSDGDVVQDSGYIVDLYDCDMSGLCNAGPHCSLPPHSPCNVLSGAASGTTADSICAGLGQGVCRKERTATGPRCHLDPQKKCAENNPGDTVCSGPGDFCETRLIGSPVAQAAGGVAVCNVSTLSEDVVGTVNILTGAGELKVRQRAVVYNPITQDKPCPVCGGFCAIDRDRCVDDDDCSPGMGPCVTELLCSDGARQDKPCRASAPFGGELPFFGVTSMDCPPNTGLITNTSGGLDINTNPRGTNSYSLSPGVACTQAGFNNKTCLGGTSEGRPCTVDSECPGGTCTHQCFCSSQQRPNGCQPACVGGANDAALCGNDGDCPGGFCHSADCREDPLDMDSDQEGVCTSGPSDKLCSSTTFKGCLADADCQPPACAYCEVGETCVNVPRQCFVNSGITRTGAAGFPDRSTASVYCVPSNSPAINASAGFGGPGALIQNETLLVVP
jgi:hypothetical protein